MIDSNGNAQHNCDFWRAAARRAAVRPKTNAAVTEFVAYCLLGLTLLLAMPVRAAEETNERATASGTWKWTFTMPDGSKVEPRVKLKQEGDKLTGTSRFRYPLLTAEGYIVRGLLDDSFPKRHTS